MDMEFNKNACFELVGSAKLNLETLMNFVPALKEHPICNMIKMQLEEAEKMLLKD